MRTTNERPQLIAMWKETTKNGKVILKGKIEGRECIGFFTSADQKNKNPKLPMIRVCLANDELTPLFALWETTSKKGTAYLYGLTNEDEKIVAFYGKPGTKQPFISVYEQQDLPK